MASMSILIQAKGASSAATLPTGTAVIHLVESIAMATVIANASGAATKPPAAIAATHRMASTNCKPTHKALRTNLIAPLLRGRNAGNEPPPDSREVKLNKGTRRSKR